MAVSRLLMLAGIALAGLTAGGVAFRHAGLAAPQRVQLQEKSAPPNVDAELIIAVDVSYSMDPDEQALQREGYILGLTSAEFLNALKQGTHGRIAVTYFEWAGERDQKTIVPWRLIDGEASAKAVADEIAAAPYRRSYRTSISGALQYAAPLFGTSEFRGMRRVVDVSGDGANNQGPPVTAVRDQLLAQGITINGLPLVLKRPNNRYMDIDNLDVYYEDCVIGGPGSFVIPIRDRDNFKEATRTKLVQEVAGIVPKPRLIPASAQAPRVSCLIGEQMWRYRWGGGGSDFQ
jgi:hypothetical protein